MRLGLPADEDVVIDLGRQYAEELQPYVRFEPEEARNTYRKYLATASPTIYVAVDQREQIVGFTLAHICGYAFNSSIFTRLEIIYVRPDRRGTRAAAALVSEFVQWSDMLGALENFGGNSNSFKSDRTARFLGFFGFRQVGISVKRVPGH